MGTPSPEAVYIHIPFCTNKCHYCDFNSFVLKGQPVMDYLDGLEREMERTVRAVPPDTIKTIFVGGGTPTVLLPDQMEHFLRLVRTYFPTQADDIEITMEANPGTTDEEKLSVMRAGGVNRLSFGVQSFDNALLEAIGRIHNTDDVYRSIETAQKVGFTNLSIDLMFNLPRQTVDILSRTLDAALALDLKHYSIYSLKVEENTLFHTLYERNQLPLPEEEEEIEMFLLIMERLKGAGYGQYEISNFARPGYESRHNITYWKNRSYYGLGAGAHGYWNGLRHINVKGVQPYIDATRKDLPRLEVNEVSRQEAMEDFMMVGLRMLEGVSDSDFREQFGGQSIRSVFGERIDKLAAVGLLTETESGVRLSDRGILLGNEVFGEFIGILS
ncbi:radical SAM family heme chaperone HemW [Paenibacillus aurantius]|uniref:Heme chaperone HemW n=1 Tax=Paenibacillus aurantius TaxID=2918900 RepID=A0AA96LG61_9BACL|nr:radical SAM family heme chaperone HemW [Paenibacillus aurantius]WNQ13434.1 radical SAM family heme chaperone HemW [Paenibacillus aurantius]